MADEGMKRDLPGRARAARTLVCVAIATLIVQMAYEGAADLAVFGADYDAPLWSLIDTVSSVADFISVIALAMWASALMERVQRAWPGSDASLPPPHGMAWLVFLFPLTLFFPWLYLRRAARLTGSARGARAATWYYAGLAALSVLGGVTVAFDPYAVMPESEAWWLGWTVVFWSVVIGISALALPMIGHVTKAAVEGDVGDVFA